MNLFKLEEEHSKNCQVIEVNFLQMKEKLKFIISVAIQKGNAANIRGTLPVSDAPNEVYSL